MKILLVQTGFLGDVVLSLPVLNNLRQIYPQAELSVLTTPQAADLVRYHPGVAETLIFDKRGGDRGVAGLLQMRRKLREKRFEMVFSLHKSWRTALLLWSARIPVRFGFQEASGQFLYTKTSSRRHHAHEVLRNLALLGVIDRPVESLSQQLLLHVSQAAKDRAGELIQSVSKPLLGIAPGSVWATKRWTIEGFATVADEFYRRGFQVVLLGGIADGEVASAVEAKAQSPLINLVGNESLLVAAGVIQRMKLLLTNDSAPLHIAAAVGTPVVATFCATVPEFGYTPWQVPSECVGVANLSCRPCGRHGGMTCPTGTHFCQRKLLAQDVIFAIERVLQVQ